MDRAGGARIVVAALGAWAALGLPAAAGQDDGKPADKPPARPAPLDADLDPEREILREARSDSRNLKPDELPPIRNPVHVPGFEAPRMDNEEWVIGVVVAGKALAYPVNILNSHEIVVDAVEGVPFLVCW